MGNINYNNLMCENYYCQSVSYKPEWFSENSWSIDYKLLIDDNNQKIKLNENKPYKLNKGLLKISDTLDFDLILSKQLLINSNEIKHFLIPINFKYFIINNIDLYVLFSNNLLKLNNIDLQLKNDNIFFIKLSLYKKKINISRSTDNNISEYKIKSKKNNLFNILIENNIDYLSINEELIQNEKSKTQINNYIKIFDITNNNLYLSILIKNKNNLIENNQYIELNFQ
jgi:hypothetical protein